MAEPLKNIYNHTFFDAFTQALKKLSADFNKSLFLEELFNDQWEAKELKERMRHITLALKSQLSENYKDNVAFLIKLIPELKNAGFKSDNLEFIFLPDFIEVFGLDDYSTSIKAFEELTQFITCEFAVRPFIMKYENTMMAQMLDWSRHKHPMVRRLSSEGCRPRLPWAMGLPALKKDPASILPILENLKNDTSESVRRSVANNLNDISKDHPELVLRIVKSWQGKTKHTDQLIKHASRTLLKQGNSEILQLFGFAPTDKIKIAEFKIHTPVVRIGEYFEFSFNLLNTSSTSLKIRLEYGIYYQKANASLSRKIFKISEKEYAGKSTTRINRRQHFKIITTRKLYVGPHQVSIIANGQEIGKYDFELVS
jgi:3-methyladenine DNA glycosylase AlkC